MTNLREKTLEIQSLGSLVKKKPIDVMIVSEETPAGRFSLLEGLTIRLISAGKKVRVPDSGNTWLSEGKEFQKKHSWWGRTLSNSSAVHCIVASIGFFWTKAIPIIILGRFFGGKVVVQFSCCHLVDHCIKWRALTRPVLRLADSVLVESRHCSYQLSAIGLSNTRRQLPLATCQDNVRKIDSVQPRMLVVSPLDKAHNPLCALRGYELVKQKFPRAEIVFAGEGPLADSIKNAVDKKGLSGVSVVSYKTQEDLNRLFDETDLYVHVASYSSSIGWLLEALSRGLPVVSSDESNAHELIRDKSNGLVFGINSHVQLAERVIAFVESPELVSACSKKAFLDARQFSWESVRQQWLTLY